MKTTDKNSTAPLNSDQTAKTAAAPLTEDTVQSSTDKSTVSAVLPDSKHRKKYVRAEKARRAQKRAAEMNKLLDSDPESDDNIPAPEPAHRASRRKGRKYNRRLYFITGTLVSVLSLIGLVSVIRFAGGAVWDILNNTGQKEDMKMAVYPLVICDPAPFDEPSKLRGDTVVTAACWEVILRGDTERYTKDFDYITVPAADIEQAAADLFGEGIAITHTSIINSDIQFYYSSDKQSYRIPYKPQYFSYSPVIEEIQAQGDIYRVEVGYRTPTPTWFAGEDGEAALPDKYMTYTLKKQGDGYTIAAAALSDKHVENDSGL